MKRNYLLYLIAVFAVFLLTNAAFASLDLGIEELTLDPGEFYEFIPQEGTVYWQISDESVLEFGGEEYIGIRALEPGTAVVFAMSDDYSEADSCVVTVTGEAKAVKSADLYYQQLTEEDLAKVNDHALASVLKMANNTAAFPMGIGDLSGFDYKVLVAVKDGSQQTIADAAEAMGCSDVWAYKYISMVALCGDANDIAKLLIDYRDDIVSIETDEAYSLDSYEENSIDPYYNQGISWLSTNAEKLTDIKAAHALGYTGEGQYIAIIDTGIKDDHIEFLDDEGNSRVAYQHCYSSESTGKETSYGLRRVYKVTRPVCEGGKTEAESGAPSGAQFPSKFNHGTHVAGIAAGRHGVAPGAKIIAIQAFSEIIYYKYNLIGEVTDEVYKSKTEIFESEELLAMQFILDLIVNEGIVPAAVNMSYGDPEKKYSSYEEYPGDKLIQDILKAGTISCNSSGNEGYKGFVNNTSSSKYTFSVGALSNRSDPKVADWSNHSKLVNILAPGCDIYSSLYTGTNTYGDKSGTSMAAPMVSGAFALLRQAFPDNTVDENVCFMLNSTTKSATRNKVTVPVLNFAHFSEYVLDAPIYGEDFEVGSGNRVIGVSANFIDEDSILDGYKVAIYTSAGKLVLSDYLTSGEAINKFDLTNNETYKVRVWGFFEISGTKYYTPYTEKLMVPMAYPTGLNLTPYGDDGVTVEWKNHPNDTIKVECSVVEDFSASETHEVIGSYTFTGLEKNKLYYLRFAWYNEISESYSPFSLAIPYVIPESPEEMTPMIGYKKVRVYFDHGDDILTGHQVKAYINNGSDKLVSTVNVKRTSNQDYADITNLVNGTNYRFEIRAYVTVGKTTFYSEPAYAYATPQLKPEGGDTTVSVDSLGSKKITATWNKDLWPGGHYIELYREDNRVQVTYAYAPATSNSYTFPTGKVDYDVLYFVRVWKYNEKSPKATGNTYIDKYVVSLATPTSFNATPSNNSIKVSWAYKGMADSVKVYVSTSSSGPFDQVGCTAPKGTNSCTINGLTNGQLYYVKAVSSYTYTEPEYTKEFTSAATSVKAVMPLPETKATVSTVQTVGSTYVQVEYAKNKDVDGHTIQVYKMNGNKATWVKTVPSTDNVAGDTVKVSILGLSKNTTYRITICSYKTVGRTTYRGAISTYDKIRLPESTSESKELIGVSDIGEDFDGFVDPVEELNALAESEDAIEAVEAEVSQQDGSPVIFDMVQLR